MATQELPCFAFECVALVSNRSECVQQLLAKSVATTSSCHTELELALALALSATENYTLQAHEYTENCRECLPVTHSELFVRRCPAILQLTLHSCTAPFPSSFSQSKSSFMKQIIMATLGYSIWWPRKFFLLLPQKCILRVLAIFCETKERNNALVDIMHNEARLIYRVSKNKVTSRKRKNPN